MAYEAVNRSPDDGKSPDELKHEIDERREQLVRKVEALGDEVQARVEGAKEAVVDTVEGVKKTFDVRYQINQHPMVAVGIAVGAGLLVGMLAGGSRRRFARRRASSITAANYQSSGATSSTSGVTGTISNLTGQVQTQLGREFRGLKDAVITTGVGLLGALARDTFLTPMKQQFDQLSRRERQQGTMNGHAHPDSPSAANPS